MLKVLNYRYKQIAHGAIEIVGDFYWEDTLYRIEYNDSEQGSQWYRESDNQPLFHHEFPKTLRLAIENHAWDQPSRAPLY